eukprot:255355_1
MSASSDPWIKLELPISFAGLMPTPTGYISKHDQKEYWIITPHYVNSRTVRQYDLENDKYLDFVAYPNGFRPNCHGSSFDPQTNELYLYSGYSRHFAILNIETKEWDVKWIKDDSLVDSELNRATYNVPAISKVSSAFLPPPINEIHLFGFNNDCNISQHLKYDKQKQKFIVLHTFAVKVTRPKMLWIQKQNKLMLFGGEELYSNTIYFCEIDTNTTVYEWKEFELKLPLDRGNNFEVTVAFESIVIAVYYQRVGWDHYGRGGNRKRKNIDGEIWCLDLIHNEWIKSDVGGPSVKISHLVQTSNRYLHCIRFAKDNKHWKIKLSEIIPDILSERYSQRYLVVIKTFCRRTRDDIPGDIIKLILKYYPVFI